MFAHNDNKEEEKETQLDIDIQKQHLSDDQQHNSNEQADSEDGAEEQPILDSSSPEPPISDAASDEVVSNEPDSAEITVPPTALLDLQDQRSPSSSRAISRFDSSSSDIFSPTSPKYTSL
mmetsp:Transcript_19019/g.28740  ORF Transcript_19019/g.28740 Transcript_19019/m.28740 type:complete len:120 (-) Transcript_19019:387-746(-)